MSVDLETRAGFLALDQGQQVDVIALDEGPP